MNTLNLKPAIVKDTEIMNGTPVFAGSRVPVETLFDYLQHGETLETFIAYFPIVQRQVAAEVLASYPHPQPPLPLAGEGETLRNHLGAPLSRFRERGLGGEGKRQGMKI